MTHPSEPDFGGPRMDADMPDYSDPGGDDFESLSRDRVPLRTAVPDDLEAILRIDRKITGRERRDYFEAKMREVMGETGVRISLVAELDGDVVGFVMARVDYGDFGRAEPAAVIDTLGVNPAFTHHGIGSALLSQLFTNLAALHVESTRTRARWNDFQLLGFLEESGFQPAQQLVLRKKLT